MEIINNKTESETLLNCFRIKKVEEIDILVGYCRYSAFYDIANDEIARDTFLKANVKIIVGMNIDNKSKCIYSNFQNESNEKEDINKTINDFLDYTISEKNTKNIKVIELFKEKCKNSTLEIRKTKEDNHGKLYLFKYLKKENETSFEDGLFLTGSSNFSHKGIYERREFNILGFEYFKTLYDFFSKEWEEAETILNKENEKEFFDKVGIKDKEEIKQNNNDAKETNKYPTPYEIYLKVIYEYFNFFSNEKLLFTPKDFNYSNYKYQIDAIKSGIKSIMTYGGVLISDVVGLGKSIIASAIAKNLIEMKAVEEIIIVSPPKIIYSWENYNAEFKLNAVIKSVGKLDELYEYVKNHKKTRLVIIDEAHRFVNSKTESYNIIKNICSSNKVMLLTATPMHNTTSDIFSLVDIFDRMLTTDKSIAEIKSSILKEERIIKSKYKKDDNEKETKEKIKDISKQILGLINPIIIRRTRKDLKEDLEYRKDLEEQKTEFNNVEDPKLHDYNLGDISKLYSDTFEKITPNDDEYNNKGNDKTLFDDNNNNTEINNNKFKAVRYEPLTYLKYTTIEEKKNADKIIEYVYGENINADFASTSSRNLTKFMKHLLVRRFESSLYAFKKSIDNMIDKYENIKTWINKDLYPIYKKGDTLYIEDFFSYDESSDDENDIEYDEVLDFNKANKKIKDVKIIENVKEVLEDKFFEDFENDLQILKQIKKDWDNISSDKDKKFIKLIEELKKFKKENDKRKIIIFTEFKDTADYLYESVYKDDELRELFKPIKSTSQSKNRDIIAANFDASLNTNKQKDDYFLLIATDTLSEGINLHRAGIIINYDIPYNPTRVIQRVGRINRIGKKLFDKIYIHNFIPRLEAQKDIKNWQISNFKLNLINAIFGNDTKILKKDDEINSLFSLKRENEILTDDDISWDNEYRDVYNKLKNDDKLLERIKSIENNIVIRRQSNFSGLLEIIQSKNGVFGSLLKNSKIDFNIENIFKTLKADKNEKYIPPSENIKNFEDELKRRKNIKKSTSSHSALSNFYQYLDNDDDRDYVKKLISITENKYLSDKTIKEIEKALKSKSGCSVKILQNIISLDEVNEKFNYSSNNLQSIYEDSYLIVKEEFSKYND